nr:MAG TPA: hypothetical protein [Caudoviricetes sp.]
MLWLKQNKRLKSKNRLSIERRNRNRRPAKGIPGSS